jgi:hypothetical protein
MQCVSRASRGAIVAPGRGLFLCWMWPLILSFRHVCFALRDEKEQEKTQKSCNVFAGQILVSLFFSFPESELCSCALWCSPELV